MDGRRRSRTSVGNGRTHFLENTLKKAGKSYALEACRGAMRQNERKICVYVRGSKVLNF